MSGFQPCCTHTDFFFELDSLVYSISKKEREAGSLRFKDNLRLDFMFIKIAQGFSLRHFPCLSHVNSSAQVDPCDPPQGQLLSRIWIMQIACLEMSKKEIGIGHVSYIQ